MLRVHWNSIKKAWSVKNLVENKRLYLAYFAMKDFTCKVYQSGYQRFLKEGHRNVHAFVEGSIYPYANFMNESKRHKFKLLRYNPHIHNFFFNEYDEKVNGGEIAYFDVDGRIYYL